MKRKRYSNLDGVLANRSFKDLRKWQRERRAKIPDLSYVVPQSDVKEISFLQSNRTKITITWIGHATFLIQCGGLNIVTDPVWAMRMGFAKRQSDPGLSIHELPPIDIVLISHAHYDHLHIRSLKALPGSPKLLVPEGLSRMLCRKGFSHVEEMPWWQSTTIQNVAFTMDAGPALDTAHTMGYEHFALGRLADPKVRRTWPYHLLRRGQRLFPRI